MEYTIKIQAQHLQFLINILEGVVLPVPMNESLPIHQSLVQQRRSQDEMQLWPVIKTKRAARKRKK